MGQKYRPSRDILEDVLFLADVDPLTASIRIGKSPKAIAEALRRQGRTDLGRPYEALVFRLRYAAGLTPRQVRGCALGKAKP